MCASIWFSDHIRVCLWYWYIGDTRWFSGGLFYQSVYMWCQMVFWSYSQGQKTVQAAKGAAIHVLNPIPGQIAEENKKYFKQIRK